MTKLAGNIPYQNCTIIIELMEYLLVRRRQPTAHIVEKLDVGTKEYHSLLIGLTISIQGHLFFIN